MSTIRNTRPKPPCAPRSIWRWPEAIRAVEPTRWRATRRDRGHRGATGPDRVARFCDICTKCADACPVQALPYGPPRVGGVNRSAIRGVRKWTSDAEKCFGFWAKMASDCAICLRVCPFNRDYGKRRHRLWLRLALSPLRRLALWLDRGRGKRVKPSTGWGQA